MRRVLMLALLMGATASAQSPLDTRTIELRHLKPSEAVKLLKPYIASTGGGVFDVSDEIPIITIRDMADNISKMEKVLAKYDHSPATIRFVFQLIEADTGPRLLAASNTKPVSVDLDSTLRSVLRFPVYRLLTQSIATAGEFSHVRQQLAYSEGGSTYELVADVGTIRVTAADPASAGTGRVDTTAAGSVRLTISLSISGNEIAAAKGGQRTQPLLSTGLDVPLGQTIVLGTSGLWKDRSALILTVKPELVIAR